MPQWFPEFQTYFSQDYAQTAWIHSIVDCVTMLCGKYLLGQTITGSLLTVHNSDLPLSLMACFTEQKGYGKNWLNLCKEKNMILPLTKLNQTCCWN